MKRLLLNFSTKSIRPLPIKQFFLFIFFLSFSIFAYTQASGNMDLGSEISNGVMTDGCVSSCQPTYCTNQADNAGNHPVETITVTITGIPAANSAEITFTSVLCGGSSGLDGGDDIFIDGVKVFDGSGNAEVNLVECVAGGADIVIEFTVNRRDEILNVSWTSGPTDPGAGCIDAVVEVEYSDFYAQQKNDQVRLEWTTLKEVQNDYFEILHSSNGMHYNAIGKVLGEGDSDYTKSYNFTHDEAAEGTNYYRLKQYDFNGVYKMSKTVSVDVKNEIRFSVLPSLVEDRITITYPGKSNARILNLQGQIVDVLQINEYLEYDASRLSPGIYIISTSLNGKILNERFIKK